MSDFFRMPSFKSILIIFFVIYIALLILIYVFQRSLQYFPSGTSTLPSGFEEVKLKTQDDVEIMVWQKIPEKYKKIIVYFHGNAGNIGDRTYRLETFVEKGYGVVALSYRGYFGSQGSPSQTGLINDAKAVMRYLNSKNISKQDLILFGESLGSGVAVQVGANYSSSHIFKPLINREVSAKDDNTPQNQEANLADNLSNNPQDNANNSQQVDSSSKQSENSSQVINSSSGDSDKSQQVSSKTDNSQQVNQTADNITNQASSNDSTEVKNNNLSDQFFMIVLESPFFNIEEVAKKTYPILPVKLLLQDRYDSNLFAPNIKSPVLFFHGDKDRVVPIESGRKLYSLITSRKKFVELRGSYHVDTNPDFLIEQIELFSSK
ncbi:MAG: hypothetical protein RL769_722 [Pseudomonadota bacterium]|jgi:fermentation-respiration switch protein FrsA (DUF1100 family)